MTFVLSARVEKTVGLLSGVFLLCGLLLPKILYADGLFRDRMQERILERIQEKGGRTHVLEQLEWEESLSYSGIIRTYRIHLPPSYDSASPVPLVVVFHEHGSNAEAVSRKFRMNDQADKEGFIVVYPNGNGQPIKKSFGWNLKDNSDLWFIQSLIEKIQNQYNIDSRRIYAAGISKGGAMAYRAACELTDKIAAVGIVPDRQGSLILFDGREGTESTWSAEKKGGISAPEILWDFFSRHPKKDVQEN